MPYPTAPTDIQHRASKIRLACFDVDGVMTDGAITYLADGQEIKSFHVHDGLGLKLLQDAGITVALVTARASAVVTARAKELKLVHVRQGVKDKLAEVQALAASLALALDQVSFTGDDLPDLGPIQAVGLGIAVANAHPLVLSRARWRTERRGGAGAVREVCDLILQAQGRYELPAINGR